MINQTRHEIPNGDKPASEMTKRERFALARLSVSRIAADGTRQDAIADAITWADEMLAALGEPSASTSEADRLRSQLVELIEAAYPFAAINSSEPTTRITVNSASIAALRRALRLPEQGEDA